MPTAEKIYADALDNARALEKAVLLVFTKHDESWCDRLDSFHADAEVSSVLEKYFITVRINLDHTPGGEQMYGERGGTRGSPAFSIVDYKGMLLADSGDGDQNVGFPNNDNEVARYLTALKTACPQITDDDLAILRAKLEAMRSE